MVCIIAMELFMNILCTIGKAGGRLEIRSV